jgi:hypothetical protein
MKRLLLLTLSVCLFGCEEPSAPNHAGSNQTATNAPSPPPPPPPPPPLPSPSTSESSPPSSSVSSHNALSSAKRVLSLNIGSKLQGQLFQGDTFNQLDAGLIESKIRALPWNDPNALSEVTLLEEIEDSEEGKVLDQLTITGSFKAVSQMDQVSAQMNESPGGVLHTLRTRKIQSVDQIVAICLSYFQNDGKVKSMVKWTDSSDESTAFLKITVPAKNSTSPDEAYEEEDYDELSPQLIESKIRSLNWNDPNGNAEAYLMYSLDRYMRVRGSLHPKDKDKAIMVEWSEMGKERPKKIFRYAKSIDQVIPLMISYFKKDDKYKTMIQWEDKNISE